MEGVRPPLDDHAGQLAEGCVVCRGSTDLVESISAEPHHADSDVKVSLLVVGAWEP